MHVHIGRYYLLFQASTGGLGLWPAHKQDGCTHIHSPGCDCPLLPQLDLIPGFALSLHPSLHFQILPLFPLHCFLPSECPLLPIFKTHEALTVAPIYLSLYLDSSRPIPSHTAPSSCPAPTIPKCLCCQLSHKSFS